MFEVYPVYGWMAAIATTLFIIKIILMFFTGDFDFDGDGDFGGDLDGDVDHGSSIAFTIFSIQSVIE